jgi:5-methylcytosine-specific restriction endonuclease McrA
VAQGAASKVKISIFLDEAENEPTSILRVQDNGRGITNTKRLLTWASRTSTDVHHRYGHGSKKCLTKWHKDYEAANGYVRFRTVDKRGNYGSLFTYRLPFRGLEHIPEEDADDETTLVPSGTEWCIYFRRSILANHGKSAKDLCNILKELLRTRYSRTYFYKTEFEISVKEGDTCISENSSVACWKTFEECLIEEVQKKNAIITFNKTISFAEGVIMRYTQYHLAEINGRKKFDLKSEFPTYGNKNQKCARVHIALCGRTIEIPYIWNFYSGYSAPHNDLNGLFGIVDFVSEVGEYANMPTPCTTKVSFYNQCPHYKKMAQILCDIHADLRNQKLVVAEPVMAAAAAAAAAAAVVPEPVMPAETAVQEPEVTPRILKISKSRPKTPKGVRIDVWNTYIGEDIAKHKCLCCKIETILTTRFECGHVLAVKNGGTDTIANLRPICGKCNKSMGAKNMRDYVIEHEYFIG